MQEDSGPGKEHVALAGPNPKHIDEDFYATAYPKVHGKLNSGLEEQSSNHTSAPPVTLQLLISFPKPSSTGQTQHQSTQIAYSNIFLTIPVITKFIALKLRVPKLEQDMSEVMRLITCCCFGFYFNTKFLHVVENKDKNPETRSKEIFRINGNKVRMKTKASVYYQSTYKAALKNLNLKEVKMPLDKKLQKGKYHTKKADSDDDEGDDDEGHSAWIFFKTRVSQQKGEDTIQVLLAQQPPAHTSSAWQITDTRDTPPGPSMQRSDHQSEQSSDDNPITDEGHASDPEMGDIGSFIKWFCKRTRKKKLCKADLEGLTFNLVKAFHNSSVSLQFQMDECHKLLTDKVDLVNPEGHQILRNVYEPLPLGGPPGQVTIQPQLFFNKDLECLLSGDKERKTALSISKLKAARYLDFSLEELVLYLWVESERDYDISAAYGITHWWFRRKEFYINKHRKPLDHDAVRSHMRIFSVISIKTYERYGYNYLREIVLRRADYKEYKISEKDFKNLHPNDFEDLFLLHLQDKLNHLPKSDKLGVESYQTKLNLEQPNWDASDFLFKKDYTIINKPRAVIYRDMDDNKKMMRIDEDTLPILLSFTHCGNKTILRVLRIILVILPEHPSETKVFHNEDGNPARANIKQALGSYERSHKGVKASANSDIVYFFTSAQDGNTLQDDERLDLADDLMKAQVHNQRQVNDESKDH
ncbi:hypothetical protein Tco_0698987 [Tanacetum coccineum]